MLPHVDILRIVEFLIVIGLLIARFSRWGQRRESADVTVRRMVEDMQIDLKELHRRWHEMNNWRQALPNTLTDQFVPRREAELLIAESKEDRTRLRVDLEALRRKMNDRGPRE